MLFILAGFIGIAINIWRDVYGAGGPPGSSALMQRDTAIIMQRDGAVIFTRA